MLFDDLLADYGEARPREGKSVTQGEFAWRRLREAVGGRAVESITTRDIEEWNETLAALTPARINRHLTRCARY